MAQARQHSEIFEEATGAGFRGVSRLFLTFPQLGDFWAKADPVDALERFKCVYRDHLEKQDYQWKDGDFIALVKEDHADGQGQHFHVWVNHGSKRANGSNVTVPWSLLDTIFDKHGKYEKIKGNRQQVIDYFRKSSVPVCFPMSWDALVDTTEKKQGSAMAVLAGTCPFCETAWVCSCDDNLDLNLAELCACYD